MTAFVNPEIYRQHLVQQFELLGKLDSLEIPPTILPVWIMGERVAGEVTATAPIYDTWSTDEVANPAANTVLADTGALTAGIYDCCFSLTGSSGVDVPFLIQHRNAANSANVKTFNLVLSNGPLRFEFPVTLALNERLRFVVGTVGPVSGRVASCIAHGARS